MPFFSRLRVPKTGTPPPDFPNAHDIGRANTRQCAEAGAAAARGRGAWACTAPPCCRVRVRRGCSSPRPSWFGQPPVCVQLTLRPSPSLAQAAQGGRRSRALRAAGADHGAGQAGDRASREVNRAPLLPCCVAARARPDSPAKSVVCAMTCGPSRRPDAAAGAQQPKITEMFSKGTPKTVLKADKPALPTKGASSSPEECNTQRADHGWDSHRVLAAVVRADHGSPHEVGIPASPAALRCGAAIVASSPATASPSPRLVGEVRSARKSKLSLKRKTSPIGSGETQREEERRAEDRRREQLREEARRRHLREEEDRRVQERWEREDLQTLASSRVPPPQEMVVETEDEEESVGQERPLAPGRREVEVGTSRRATECIELLDSSQEEEEFEAAGTGSEITGRDRRAGADFGHAAHGAGRGWEVEIDENGVLLEDEPDDEELGVRHHPLHR